MWPPTLRVQRSLTWHLLWLGTSDCRTLECQMFLLISVNVLTDAVNAGTMSVGLEEHPNLSSVLPSIAFHTEHCQAECQLAHWESFANAALLTKHRQERAVPAPSRMVVGPCVLLSLGWMDVALQPCAVLHFGIDTRPQLHARPSCTRSCRFLDIQQHFTLVSYCNRRLPITRKAGS